MLKEDHFVNRSDWLRAAMLGANDGIVSTASLLVGVLAAGMDRSGVLLTGLAGLTAGAFSMAAGEYIAVSAQADTEAADLARERRGLQEDPENELHELAQGFEARGVSPDLALRVAQEMTAHDALAAHAREELGLANLTGPKPLQAALASLVAFAIGGVLPLIGALIAVDGHGVLVIAAQTLLALALLGGTGARLGGAPIGPGIVRALFWGGLAMTVTFWVGRLFELGL